MSTDDPKEQEAPERTVADKDEEDDTEGHRPHSMTSDPDFGGRDLSKADEDDTEGHRTRT